MAPSVAPAPPALLLIDIQNDYFPGGRWTLAGIEDAAENAARLLEAARKAGTPVVHVRHEFPNAAEAPFFAPGSPGAEIHQSVKSREGEPVVLKHQINSFKETDLKGILDRAGVKDLVICGAMSHMCVDAATRAAGDLGYRCTVIHDACASRDQVFEGQCVSASHVHASFMAALQFGYAKVISTDEFLGQHGGTAAS